MKEKGGQRESYKNDKGGTEKLKVFKMKYEKAQTRKTDRRMREMDMIGIIR